MSLPVNNLSPGLSSSQSLSTRLMQTLGVKIPGSESYQNEQQIIGEYIDLVTGQEPNMKKPLRQWIQRVLSLSQGGVDEKEVQQLLDSERLKNEIGVKNAVLLLGRGVQISLLIARHREGESKVRAAMAAKNFADALVKFSSSVEFDRNIAQLEKSTFDQGDVAPEFLARIQSEANRAFMKKVGIAALGVIGALSTIYGVYWFFSERKESSIVQPGSTIKLEIKVPTGVDNAFQKTKEILNGKIDKVLVKTKETLQEVMPVIHTSEEQSTDFVKDDWLEKIPGKNWILGGTGFLALTALFRKCFSKAAKPANNNYKDRQPIIGSPDGKLVNAGNYSVIADPTNKLDWLGDILSCVGAASLEGIDLNTFTGDCEVMPQTITSSTNQGHLVLSPRTELGVGHYPRTALVIFKALLETADGFKDIDFSGKDYRSIGQDNNEIRVIAEILWKLQSLGLGEKGLAKWLANIMVKDPNPEYIEGIRDFLQNEETIRARLNWKKESEKVVEIREKMRKAQSVDWREALLLLHEADARKVWQTNLCSSIYNQCEDFISALFANDEPLSQDTVEKKAAEIVGKSDAGGMQLTLPGPSLLDDNGNFRKVTAHAYWRIFKELVRGNGIFQKMPIPPVDNKEATLDASNRELIKNVPPGIVSTLCKMHELLKAKGFENWVTEEIGAVIPEDQNRDQWKIALKHLLDNKGLFRTNEKPKPLQIEAQLDVQKLMGKTFKNEIEFNAWKRSVLNEFAKYFAYEDACKTPGLAVSEEKKKDAAFVQRVAIFLQQIGQVGKPEQVTPLQAEPLTLSVQDFKDLPDEFTKNYPDTPLVISHAFQLFMQTYNSLSWSEHNIFVDLEAFSKEDPENRKNLAPKILVKLDESSKDVLRLFVKISQAMATGQKGDKAFVEKLALLFGDKKELKEFLCFLIEQPNAEDFFKAPSNQPANNSDALVVT